MRLQILPIILYNKDIKGTVKNNSKIFQTKRDIDDLISSLLFGEAIVVFPMAISCIKFEKGFI